MGVDRGAMDEERRGGFFKPKEGNNFLFLLPPKVEQKKPWIEIYMHYGVGVNNKSLVCPNKMENKPCPVCEKAGKIYAEGTKESKELAKKYWPGTSWYAGVIDLKDVHLLPQIWRFGVTVKRELVDCFYDAEEPDKFIDYTNLEAGFKVVLKRIDKSTNENYIDYKATLGKAYSFDKPKEILKNLPDMSEYTVCLTYDEIKEIMSSDYQTTEEPVDKSPKGVDPLPMETKKEEAQIQAEPSGELVKKEKGSDKPKPKCYGKEYSTDDDECLECPYEEECAKLTKK